MIRKKGLFEKSPFCLRQHSRGVAPAAKKLLLWAIFIWKLIICATNENSTHYKKSNARILYPALNKTCLSFPRKRNCNRVACVNASSENHQKYSSALRERSCGVASGGAPAGLPPAAKKNFYYRLCLYGNSLFEQLMKFPRITRNPMCGFYTRL